MFNFASFNKERLFTIDTGDFDYVNLEDLVKRDGEGVVYKVRGVYVGTKSLYDPEAPMLATESEYVNLPVHQLPEIKAMLADRRAIDAINNGECGFVIESFYQKRFKKTCYAARWGNFAELEAEVAAADSDEAQSIKTFRRGAKKRTPLLERSNYGNKGYDKSGKRKT